MLTLHMDCQNVAEVYNHAFISCPVPARLPGLYRRAGNRLRGFMKGFVAGPETLGAKRIVFDSHSLLLGLCNTSPFVFFPLQLRYRHELSYTVRAARPRRQGHIYAAQISTGQRIRFDMRYLKYLGGDPLLSLVLSLAAPRPL